MNFSENISVAGSIKDIKSSGIGIIKFDPYFNLEWLKTVKDNLPLQGMRSE